GGTISAASGGYGVARYPDNMPPSLLTIQGCLHLEGNQLIGTLLDSSPINTPTLNVGPEHLNLSTCFITVQIDIKPGSSPNTINLGSGGVVPVAILSSATFDATTVNPTTVTLANAAVRLKGNGTPITEQRDVNGDGRVDLVV